MILYQVSVFLHILSAVIWIGGMLFLALVVVPATRGLAPGERAALFTAVGRRFRTVGWICISILIVTGAINSVYRGVTWETLFMPALWSSPFGTTLALKLGVVAIMLGLSVYHDFVIGPRSVQVLRQAAGPVADDTTLPRSLPLRSNILQEAGRLRHRASVVGRLEAILALVVLTLAIMLVRGVPTF